MKQHVKKSTQAPFFAELMPKQQPIKSGGPLQTATTDSSTKSEKIRNIPEGGPVKGKERIPTGYEYILDVKIDVDAEAIYPLRLKAGCFVLICNLSSKQERNQWTTASLLELYKNQSGIEQNFGFLKDPVIVNSIFLKKPNRIEVLGLVMLIALLIWRLMERSMRRYLDETESEITGWKNRPTKRPTSFMMTTKFLSILVARADRKRQLVRPLKPFQIEYLQALNVSPEVFVNP